MAKRRMIDSGIWRKPKFAALTMRQRLLLIGLFSTADDQGRRLAHPALIRSDLFPFEDIPLSEIESDLQAIESNGTIFVYQNGDHFYLQLANWWQYQNPQWASPSDYPPPSDWQDRIRCRRDGQYYEENWRSGEGSGEEDEKPIQGQTEEEGNLSPESSPESSGERSPERLALSDSDSDSDRDSNKIPEGAAIAARPPPKSRKSRKKTPKSDAVKLYRAKMHLWPTPVQEKAINGMIDSNSHQQMGIWEKTLDLWGMKRWKPTNVEGMLEVYKNNGESRYARGENSATDEPKPIPGYQLADLDEVRRCQEEQWARERAAAERAALPDVQGGGGGDARPPPGRT